MYNLLTPSLYYYMQVLTEGKLKNALRPASALFLLYFEVYNKISFIFILFGWTSEIMDRLVAEGVLSKTGGDTYTINRQKVFSSCFYFNFLSIVSCFKSNSFSL